MNALLKLIVLERAVIKCGGQTEAVLHKRFLARPVAAVHCAHLRQCNVTLVHEQKEVLREIVEQRHRRAARRAVRDYARIVLNAGAVAQLLHHLDVVIRALADALCLDKPVVLLKPLDALVALAAYLVDGGGHFLLGRDIVASGIYRGMAQYPCRHTGHDVYLAYAVDLVAEELHAYGLIVGIGRENLDRIAADAEHVALKCDVVALVAYLDKLSQQLVKIPRLAGAQ